MALTDDNLIMPVTPSGGGFMGGGDSWGWIILLLLFASGGFGGFGGNDVYPWMNQANQVNDGFAMSALGNTVNGVQNAITSGFGDVQTALCGGFAGVNASVNGAQNGITSMMYSNQIADLERSFNAQTANTQAISGISSQLAQCCCDNRLATVQTQNIVQSESAATRLAIQEQTQAILDKMCQQEIDNLKGQVVSLQNQLNMANLAASQTAQTSRFEADLTAQTQYLIANLTPVV